MEKADSAIEVAVVEENLPTGDEQEGAALPSNLNMTINLFQNDTNAVDLRLDMNNAMNEQRSIYVIRTNKAGKQVLKKEQIPIEGNIAFYQDKDTGANVMVRCDGFTSGKCDPTLEGSFFVDQVEYGLEPLPFDSPERKKRSVTGSRRGKLYSVFKRKQDKPVKDDFVKESATGPGQSMQMVDRIVDLSEFLSPESASMTMRRRVSHYPKRRPKKQFRTDDTPYEMGLIVLIDYSVYRSWYQRSHQKTHAEKDIEAKSKIRQYMSHVINGIDLRFQNLKVNRVKVVVSRYIIADTPEASHWTADRLEASPRDLVYADEVLNKLIKWRFRMGMDLPVHDHVILFTGYDLYRPTVQNKGVAGFARVKSMCTHTSVSIVEEHGGFNSILTATHEIGHSLGAYHDGHNNSCVGQDNYIMTPIGGSATPSNALNPFQFSPCSQDAFQSYLDSLPTKNCLTDETDIYDEEEFREHLSQEAGQLYGPNEQCKQHLGQSSYYAWGGILGDAAEVCTHMACKNSMSDTSFNIYYAARGTSCGNKKWCIDGVCTYSEEAPDRKAPPNETMSFTNDKIDEKLSKVLMEESLFSTLHSLRDDIRNENHKMMQRLVDKISILEDENKKLRKNVSVLQSRLFTVVDTLEAHLVRGNTTEQHDSNNSIKVIEVKDSGPRPIENCVHGDAQRMFGNKTCSQYISEDPGRCYFSYYNRFCCTSCDRVRRHQRGE
ncbi:A disintegrin and metalloproteinase with thrombospondin motifs like [Argopecten irradians]|uniref:A disintegrin and metalloproteinase with thrombospondin motifs like n=1 Tax=Argopecten irradians TaxID=31199 RepID=UPI00371E17BC